MSTPLILAERLGNVLTSDWPRRRDSELQSLLHPRVVFMRLGRTVEGAAAVAAELQSEATLAAWRGLRFLPPVEVDGGAVRLIGERAPGTRDRELVVTLRIEDGAIVQLQQQRQPAPAAPVVRLAIPPAVRAAVDRALVERHPMLLAYTTPLGQPVLSYRGSTQVHSDDQLAMWVRNPDGEFIRAIAANPRVALMYRNEDSRATYQFQGRARVSASPEDRRIVFERSAEAERAHDFAMLGVAVIVDLDRLEGYEGVGPGGQVGQLRMLRDAP